MAGIDESLTFTPVGVAVLTVSDTRTAADDTSGDILAGKVEEAGHRLVARAIVTDDKAAIAAQVRDWANDPEIAFVISTGGTGLTGRDVTPEALRPIFDKEIEGFSVVFHQTSFESVGVSTMQSRALAGIIGDTVVFALPGSNGAVKDGWKVIRDQLDTRHKPCNLAELRPRLTER